MLCLLFLSYEVANRTLQDVCSSTLKRRDTIQYDTLKQEQERTARQWLIRQHVLPRPGSLVSQVVAAHFLYLPFQCLAIPMFQIRSSFVGSLAKIRERLSVLACVPTVSIP